MTIAQIQLLIANAIAAGLTTSDLVFVQNGDSALTQNAVAGLNFGNEVVQLGQYQMASGSAVPVSPARGLYIGLSL